MHKDVILNRICYDRVKVRVSNIAHISILIIIILIFIHFSLGVNTALLEVTRGETNFRYETPSTNATTITSLTH